MELHTIHNPEHEKLLHKKCKPFDFTKHTKTEISAMIKEMRVKMHEWHGIGLASTQIGSNEAFFVAQPPEGGKFYAIFNPKITKTEGDPVLMEEGCLSIPGQYGDVPRYEKLVIEGQDKNGKKIKIKAWGILAHIFQHETDHTNGILYADKAKKTRAIAVTERLQGKVDSSK